MITAYDEALGALASHAHVARYRELCSDANPDTEQRDGYRELVVRVARGERPAAPSYPSLATQAGNALGAALRFAVSGGALVDQAEFDRRKAICHGCEFYVVADDRCLKCGCHLGVKQRMATEHCPLTPEPKW